MASLSQTGMQRQPLTVEVNRSFQTNDSSGSTPEPSPVGPPKATEYDLSEDMGEFTPPLSNKQQEKTTTSLEIRNQRLNDSHDVVEESIPISLPRAPSPYSPPPNSLFSGEEPLRVPAHGHQPNTRPPLQEVSIEALPSSTSHLRSNFSFEADRQEQIRQMISLGSSSYLASSPQHRSFLVPAVVQLKRELLESQQANFLLQKEHEASNAQNRAMESELRASLELLREERDKLLDSQQQCQVELQQATDKATLLEETTRQLEEDKQQLSDAVQSLTLAQVESQNQVQKQSNVIASLETSNQDLKQASDSHDAQILSLEDDKLRLQEEVARLIERLERETATATLMIPTLKQDKESLLNDLLSSKAAIEQTEAALRQSQQQVQSLQGDVKDARTKVKQIALDSSQRARDLQEQLEGAQSSLQQERSSRQLEVDRLKAVLKELEIESSKRAMQFSKEIADLQAEVSRLDLALKSSTLQSTALRGEKLALRKELALKVRQLQRYENVQSADAACQTEVTEALDANTQTETIVEGASSMWSVTGDSYHDSMTDRLGRIRDASDRAALLQEYRREMNRIKGEYHAEVRKLENQYNDSLQRVVSEAKEEVNVQTREYKRQLKTEWDAKLASLERQHLQQLNQVRFVCQYFRLDRSKTSPSSSFSLGARGVRIEHGSRRCSGRSSDV